jgi:type VI secretion system secreted protein VgrG
LANGDRNEAASRATSGLNDNLSDALDGLGGQGGDEIAHTTFRFSCDEVDEGWEAEEGALREHLSAPYQLETSLVTDNGSAQPKLLLGKSARAQIERGSLLRQVIGIISEVSEIEQNERGCRVNIVVVPAFEALGHRVDSRIFQDMTVPQILESVLKEGLEPYQREVELRVTRKYPTCEYRTQYQETDLDFCHRLMEEEGIFYWFEFEDDSEKMILADSADSHQDIETLGQGAMVRYTTYEGGVGGQEYVSAFTPRSTLHPTQVVTRHYDWTHASMPVEGDSKESDEDSDDEQAPDGAKLSPDRPQYEHDHDPLTLFNYQDSYGDNDNQDQVRLRREQQAVDSLLIDGISTAIGMTAQRIFELSNHPSGDLDGRYLLLSVSHTFRGTATQNGFVCMPADKPYRPRRLTPKPRIAGIQTAKVTGPAGEEIHTDKHGRIKVQFHWDREGRGDDKSSCFVRVIQPWAGSGWGFTFLPRIGMEVAVTFVNGDPDHPVVIGALYNSDNVTPYQLPDEKTKSTIKTNSSLGGGGSNELRFEDMAGSEEIYTHAQKDQNEVVENDHTTTVHHNQTNKVDGDHTNIIDGKHMERVGKNQSLSVSGGRSVSVGGEMHVSVNGGESTHKVVGKYLLETTEKVTVYAPEQITIGCGGSTITMEPNKIKLSAGAGAELVLDANAVLRSSQSSMAKLDDTLLISSSNNAFVQLTSDVKAESDAGGRLTLTADSEMTSAGGGVVLAQGPNVKINC